MSQTPSARTIARLMTIDRDELSKAETVVVAATEGGVPRLAEAREIIAGFQAMIRKKTLADLDPWLVRARSSLVASFANGVMKDLAAVTAAITSPWSNGQTEGQITKLKLVKRQMYGRGKLDLLQARRRLHVTGHQQNCVRAKITSLTERDFRATACTQGPILRGMDVMETARAKGDKQSPMVNGAYDRDVVPAGKAPGFLSFYAVAGLSSWSIIPCSRARSSRPLTLDGPQVFAPVAVRTP
ncbi:hypothetical protein J2852_005446 [Azospirillum soli]|nr:hypothetical protein [Azospirillum soli]